MEGRTADPHRAWDEQGFAVLRAAATAAAIQRLEAELNEAVDRLLVRAPGDEYPSLVARRPEGRGGAGAVDPYVLSGAARDLLLAAPAVAFLHEVLGAAPMLIDAVGSDAGPPGEGPYRDPTFVPLSEPESLVGMVVALGEVRLPLYPGSQRLPAEPFSDRYRHVNPERDGLHALDEHRALLQAALAEAGLTEEVVALRAGDVLVWHAELAHGAPEGPALVAHLAPASAEPQWFAQRPDRAYRITHGDGCFTSRHYALADAPGAVALEAPTTPPPAAERGRPSPETVEHALERHDDAEGTPAAPPPTRGLMGRMREAMGRRPPQP